MPIIKDKELHRVVMTAIIYRPDRTYLITKRGMKKKVFPGKWHVPGGGLSVDDYIHLPPENHDTQWYGVLEKSLTREVQEEVGLTIGKAEQLLDVAFIQPGGTPVLVLSCFAPYISGDVTLTDEDTADYAWITAAEAKNYDFIAGIEQEIQKVDQILAKRMK